MSDVIGMERRLAAILSADVKGYSRQRWDQTPYANQADRERDLGALRRAGLE